MKIILLMLPEVAQEQVIEPPVDNTETDDMFATQESIDYLDIPSFLRVQAD